MRVALIALLSGTIAAAQAQSAATPTPKAARRHAFVFDVTGAIGKPAIYNYKQVYLSAAAWRLWGLDRTGRFQVGVGAHLTHYRSEMAFYDLVRGTASTYRSSSIDGVYTPQILAVSAPRLWAFNAALHARARVVGPVRVGFSIDLAGLTTGSGSTQYYTPTNVRPTRWNVLLGGVKDRGSLNSEFYVSADVTPHFGIRAGLSHVVNAYEIVRDGKAVADYHKFSNLGFLGASFLL
jgi:hypothetical protein